MGARRTTKGSREKKQQRALCQKETKYSPAIFFAHADCCAGEPSLNPCVKISRGPNRTSMGSGVSLSVAGIMVADLFVCVVRRARLPLRQEASDERFARLVWHVDDSCRSLSGGT